MSFIRWEVEVGGSAHVVEVEEPKSLTGPGRSFTCDGTGYSLGGFVHRGPRVTAFTVDGHAATLTMRTVIPGFRTRLRRGFRGATKKTTFLGFILGAGVGGGVAGANAASTMLAWTIYELVVDGRPLDAYVLTSVGGTVTRWDRVRPGGRLPDGTDEDWANAAPPEAATTADQVAGGSNST